MSRPPEPTALKVLKGNPGKRPLNKAEPQPSRSALRAPAWLPAGKARQFWREIAPLVDRLGVMTEADEQALAMLCDALATYVAARSVLRTEGSTYWMGKVLTPRPENAIANNAMGQAIKLFDRFGLNPAYRAKLRIEPEVDEDPLDALRRQGHG